MPDRAAQIAALRLPLDQLPDPLPIPTIERPFDVTIRPPGSKSITNRALLLAALADGTSELRGALIDADDAQVMLAAIEQLGAKVEVVRGGTGGLPASGAANLDIVRITGVNGRWKIPAGQTVTLNLNNAGTATRFLTAAAILAPSDSGGIIIDGDKRMRERPIAELGDALGQLGVGVEYLGAPGCPPLRVLPPPSLTTLNASVAFSDPKSSQFISAMLLIAPFLSRPTTIRLSGRVLSEPYIAMTRQIITELLAQQNGPKLFASHKNDETALGTPVFSLTAFRLDIEADASGATYFLGAAALFPSARCIVAGLPWVIDCRPLQGDSMFGGVLDSMGADECADEGRTESTGPACLLPLSWSFADIPDTAMTAAVLACFATPTPDNPAATSTLRGLRTLRVKETDRLEALRVELTKLGARVEIFGDGDDEGLRVSPPAPALAGKPPVPPEAIHFDTYHDHRMAMSLALIGLRRPNVFIRNPKCVAKTYPTFWADLAKLYM